MKFKDIEIVKVRQWDDMKKEFGLDDDGDINLPYSFPQKMKQFCGHIVEVKHVNHGCSELKINYIFDGHDLPWHNYRWHEEMFELVGKNFTIHDVKFGDIIELRNKKRYVVTLNDDITGAILISNFSKSFNAYYHNDLTNCWNESLDIMKVYKIKDDCPVRGIFDDENLLLIWSREEKPILKLTKAELEDMLGYQIEIVEEE